jgi:hypothetical protein
VKATDDQHVCSASTSIALGTSFSQFRGGESIDFDASRCELISNYLHPMTEQ